VIRNIVMKEIKL